MNHKISVQGLHKSFGQDHILRGISFSANKGDVIALMGSSGSGKSTLLRCINLLTTPDHGTIQIDHQILTFDKQHPQTLSQKDIVKLRIKVGMVFQQFNLWAHKTVLENLIEAPMHVLKKSKVDAVLQAQGLLERVGLTDRKSQYPAQLSGGQQQRAAIARALMMEPDVMLFDEPTSALDPEMVTEVLNVIQSLAATGITMLVSTHELGFAHNATNKAIFLDKGVIAEQGDTKEMFAHPQTQRFQEFLKAVQT
ncbi:MAG: occP [Gammaproteobacteria bacterium]|jgi:ABC-type histidine transport system ATPase subunit|nr:occP [Gammaproteobacteria bacterium]